LVLTKKAPVIDKKIVIICLAVILWAVLAANMWRLLPPDPDKVRAVSLYTEILEDTVIVGLYWSELTTTLGNYAVKRSSENPIAAALMVRLLKDAGVTSDSVVAINASGSFPGFVLAALAACAALDVPTYVIASIGSSTFGANIPGNTIADMLLKDRVRSLGFTLLAITPGGGNDRGLALDEEELERIAQMAEHEGIPFIVPLNLSDAINLRETMFHEAGSTVLMNIGGGHASMGSNHDLALLAGVLNPAEYTTFEEAGLVQHFLMAGIPVIQVLNVNRLYGYYGLELDQTGLILSGTDRLLRHRQLHPLITFLPIIAMVGLFLQYRNTRKNQRRG
jgi:poly-gamma-glutamate system protein